MILIYLLKSLACKLGVVTGLGQLGSFFHILVRYHTNQNYGLC